jgi:hypothetical protein
MKAALRYVRRQGVLPGRQGYRGRPSEENLHSFRWGLSLDSSQYVAFFAPKPARSQSLITGAVNSGRQLALDCFRTAEMKAACAGALPRYCM